MRQSITFEFEGRVYTAPAEAYESNLIALPDGRLLSVGGWLESLPPIPRDLRLFTMADAEASAAPATELKREESRP